MVNIQCTSPLCSHLGAAGIQRLLSCQSHRPSNPSASLYSKPEKERSASVWEEAGGG